MGSVSSSSITNILMPVTRNGTRDVIHIPYDDDGSIDRIETKTTKTQKKRVKEEKTLTGYPVDGS